ncbi:hypothetical protein [Muribaculum intestinale]|uniref:hypothetical protein n=1 Tax=Muribaculum intestinale TaxID=1796646 RepID=UPI0025B07526|nr:hypothetical protein [Muribaculum intestinale]
MKTTSFSFSIPRWTMAEDLGYKPITTFWMDFSIADKFGPTAVKDTFRRAFAEWKGNYKYLTELVMVLNHKIAYHYNPAKGAPNVLANLYNELWEEADSYANTHLEGEEYAYFYSITD